VLRGLGVHHPPGRCLFADAAYQGLKAWLEGQIGWRFAIVRRPSRWVFRAARHAAYLPSGLPPAAEALDHQRTFAWLARNRRLAKGCERLCATTETWI
jgi:hypothetical protein